MNYLLDPGKRFSSKLDWCKVGEILGLLEKKVDFSGLGFVQNFKFFLVANSWQISTSDCSPALLEEDVIGKNKRTIEHTINVTSVP